MAEAKKYLKKRWLFTLSTKLPDGKYPSRLGPDIICLIKVTNNKK